MKVLVVLEVDPDKVLDSHNMPGASLEGAIEGELGWAAESGISVIEVLTPDNPIFNTEGFDLGEEIRQILE